MLPFSLKGERVSAGDTNKSNKVDKNSRTNKNPDSKVPRQPFGTGPILTDPQTIKAQKVSMKF